MIHTDTLRIFLMVTVLHYEPFYMQLRADQFEQYLAMMSDELRRDGQIIKRRRRWLWYAFAFNIACGVFNFTTPWLFR